MSMRLNKVSFEKANSIWIYLIIGFLILSVSDCGVQRDKKSKLTSFESGLYRLTQARPSSYHVQQITFRSSTGEFLNSLAGDTRESLVMDVPSQFDYFLKLPEKPIMSFGLACLNQGYKFPFQIRLNSQIVFYTNVGKDTGWKDYEIDLSNYSNKKVHMSLIVSPGEIEKGKIAVSNPMVYDISSPQRINIILISFDALRADHLGCYGYERDTSPNIDGLAKEGVIFEKAYCQSPYTLPSFASIFTSLYPSHHGVMRIDNKLSHVSKLSDGTRNLKKLSNSDAIYTLPEILRKNDYITQGFSNNPNVPLFSINQKDRGGFDRIEWYEHQDDSKLTQVAVDKAIFWLKKNYQKKFFLFLHIEDPHHPYNPIPPFNTKYIDQNYQSNKVGLFYGKGRYPFRGEYLSSGDIKRVIDLYDGEIAAADNQIARLFHKIDTLRIRENTLIIFTSDHGEEFGKRDVHGFALNAAQTHIPLLLTLPSKLPRKRIKAPVAHVDIMPTILAIVGAKCPEDIDGINLLPLIAGEKLQRQSDIIIEGLSSGEEQKSLISNYWKLVLWMQSNNAEFYDLEKDIREGENLAKIEHKKVELMKSNLMTYIKTGAQKYAISSTGTKISPEQMEKLRALGYIK